MNRTAIFLLRLSALTLVACGSGGGTPAGGTSGSTGTGGGGGGAPQAGNSPGGVSGSTSAGGDAGGAGGTNGGGMGGTAAGNGGTGGGEPLPPGIYPPGSCSDATLRTAPPAGKEMFKAAAVSAKFPFSLHWVGEWIAETDPSRIGMQTMADLDDDGDLDFAAGQRQTLPGGMVWWEHCTADHWVAHIVGTGHESQSAGDALDVDGDGLNDLLAGNSWYKNPGKSREMEWERFDANTPDAEELTVGDVTGDGKAEILYVHNTFDAQFWSPGATPEQGFMQGLSFPRRTQQGSSWGDLNGDGANDWLVNKDYWFQNNGTGTMFTERAIAATAGFDNQPLSSIGDVDGDGDNDFAISTHWQGSGGTSRLAWVENVDGKGMSWEMHQLSDEHTFTHGVNIADFDNDQDLDILWVQNVGPSFIYENTNGMGMFMEHQIVNDFRGHTPRVGDVDCDGDLDIAGSPWGDRGQASSGENVGMPARDALYLQNLTVDMGGTPIFDAQRKPYELLWRERAYCRK
jgi:hypothetical protein